MKNETRLGQVRALLLVAILLKAAFLFAGIPDVIGGGGATYQADRFPDGYDLIAMNLINGHGYRLDPATSPTIFLTPGFVLILAALFTTFGKSLLVVKVFHLLVSSVTAYLVYRLGMRITTSKSVGVIAALIYFLHPGTVIADSRGGPETAMTAMIVAFMLLIYRALERDRLRDYALAGLVFGTLLLVKSTPALFPGMLFLYLAARRRSVVGLATAGARVAMLCAATMLILTPWVVRNYLLVGTFIPTMTLQGGALFQGVHVVEGRASGKEHCTLLMEAVAEQDRIAQEMGMRYKPEFFPRFYRAKDEVRYYSHLGELGMQEYRRAPGLLAEAIAYNGYAFWFQGRTRRATTLNAIVTAPFLLLAASGLVIGRRRGFTFAPITLFVLMFYVVHLPIIAVARYHIPLIPLLAVPAGLALGALADVVRATRKPRGATARA